MRSVFLIVFLSALSFQSANALTVTLESDYRTFNRYSFGSYQYGEQADFGADFSYFANFERGYQVSGAPVQSDSNTYVFSGEGASYSYDGGGLSNVSHYNISFTVDQNASFNFDAVIDDRGGTLGWGDYQLFLLGNDGGGYLFFKSGLVFEGSPIEFHETFQLTSGTTYTLQVRTVGSSGATGDDNSYVGYDFDASITTVPIPAAIWLFGSALAGLGWLRRRQTI